MTITASCHCGANHLTLLQSPSSFTECNCTFCTKHGVLWVYAAPEQVAMQLSRPAVRAKGPDAPQHHFCTQCHCLLFYRVEQSWTNDGSIGGPMIGLNARLFDQYSLAGLPCTRVDGLTQW